MKRMNSNRIPLLALCLGLLLVAVSPGYARGVLGLVGGGRVLPGSWYDEIFRWLIAESGKGKIVLLSCDEEVNHLADYFIHLGAGKVTYLKLAKRFEADAPEAYSEIDSADGLFILDGNLRQQLDIWKGTRTESAIRDHIGAGKVLVGAGTGAQILGGVILDSRGGELDPAVFLRHLTIASFTFTDTFIGLVKDAMIEPACSRTGGIPRLALALCLRNQQNPGKFCAGLGIDEHTAVLIDDRSQATILGEGSVTLITQNASSVVRFDQRLPPVITDLDFNSFTEGFVLDLKTWQLIVAPPTVDLQPTVPLNPVFQNVIMRGSASATGNIGSIEIANTGHETLALQLGILREVSGSGRFPGAILVPQTFAEKQFYENRFGGLLWGLANDHNHIGILLDQGGIAEITPTGLVQPLPSTEQPSLIVVDPRQTLMRAFSKRKAYPDSQGPRQSVALVGAKMHILATRFAFHIPSGTVQQEP